MMKRIFLWIRDEREMRTLDSPPVWFSPWQVDSLLRVAVQVLSTHASRHDTGHWALDSRTANNLRRITIADGA